MIPLVLSIVAILFTFITAIFSILAYAKVVGMEKSTHKIQYVDPTGPTGAELAKQFMEQKDI